MDDVKKDSKNIDIPADVADAWTAVILDLALKADAAGQDDIVDGTEDMGLSPKSEIGG